MSLYQQIKADQLDARKARDTIRASLLTTLMAEAAVPGKNAGNRESTDEEVIGVVRKFIKNNLSIPDSHRNVEHDAELHILEGWLPKQLTEEQLKEVITTTVQLRSMSGKPKMGDIMKILKETLEGQYDGAMASRLIKEALA